MDEAEGILFESTVSNFLATDADQGQVRVRGQGQEDEETNTQTLV